MLYNKSLQLAAYLLASLLLPACGGGGGDDTPAPPPVVGATSVNVAQAWINLLTADRVWTTTGTGPDGRAYVLSIRSLPGPSGTYQRTGEFGQTTQHVSSATVGGQPPVTSTQTLYFNGTNLFGIEYDDGSCSIVPTLASPVPGASPIGSTASLATSYDFNTCSPQPFDDGVTSNDWSIESDAGVTLFCITSQQYDVAGTIIGKEQTCIEAMADGTLGSKARLTIYFSETSRLVTRNF
jgi:hypothetical protein